ncbi:hypothetical protein Tco_0990033 [Tanacetum coccineum]|uniref:Uncharacterized protein n=1 Tax=Tanacetum coccineum TaxID=301880 RepID=A0ABQ5EVJ3_9ASTR
MKRVNTFVDMNTELVKRNEHVEAEKDNDQEEVEMKKHIEIVKDDEVAHDAIALATKPPVIVKYQIVKEGKPEDEYERLLWGDMKFEKIKDIKVEDDSLACDSPLEVFNCEVSRLSKIDDNLFTYEVAIANIPCDLRVDDDSEHEADDMGFDPFDIAFTEWLGSNFFNYKTMDHYTKKALWIYWIRGDDKVELIDEEFSDNEDGIAEVFRIDTNIFDYETPICSAFNEFNYLLKTDTGVWTKPKPVIHTCKPFNYKTGCSEWPTCSWMNDGYCNGGNLPGTFIIENQLHYQDYEWYKALEDIELKDEALRNKAIMEGFIKDDDDESSYEQMRQWDIYTNYDDTYKTNHDDNEREELCEVHEPQVCMIQRFEMIKYSFGQSKEYVAIKKDEYDDLARKSNNACRTYQEIFRMMDEGWMVTRAELKEAEEKSNLKTSR